MPLTRIELILTILTMFLFALFANSAKATEECHLKVGVVPQFEQRRIANTWNPILKTLGEKTHCTYELVGTKTILAFEGEFKKGAFDLVYLNPYHAVMAEDAQGYVPIARSGSKMLKGILTVHKDSGITDISQLQDETLAFPSPNALGASLLMRAELKQKHGIDITPLYVKTHGSVYLHVAKKLTKAGGGVMRTLKEQRASLQNKLDVIYTTTPVPAHPLVAHSRIDDTKRLKIQQAWLDMAAENPNVFNMIPMKDPIKASMADYAPLRELGLEAFVGQKE